MIAAVLVGALTAALFVTVPAAGRDQQVQVTPLKGGASSLTSRQLLGLCSHDFNSGLKTYAPRAEWQYARNARINIQWALVERNGRHRYNWGGVDEQVNAALSVGINSVMITIGGPVPGWAATSKGDRMGPPRRLSDWEDFCYAVARRYKGYVDFYQIWQEPGWDKDAPPSQNGIVYFDGYCDLQYQGLLRAAYNGIKRANADAYVATGSLINGLWRLDGDVVNYELLLAGTGNDISMKIDCDQEIVAERPMYFNYQGKWAGGHDQAGIDGPQKLWYLAEGATHPGFEEWICIQNPGDKDANVNITYMFPGGATQGQGVKVQAHSRYTVDVNLAVGPYKDVSAKVESSEPVVVERPMYFMYHGAWPGGSVGAGQPELSKTWYLAEGATHPGFEEWISLMNPNGAAADVTLTYMFDGGGTQKQKLHMAPTSRETVLVNNIVGPNKDVSVTVEATQPIIAERPMYFAYHNAWPGGDTQVGALAAERSWFLSEGTTRSNADDGYYEEWISIQNPGNRATSVDITYMFTGGGMQKSGINVPAHARETILVNSEIGPDKDVSVQLDSTEPIIVERPMYFNYRNKYTGGHVEIGATKRSKTQYFAEGTTRTGFEEWLTLQNPNNAPATANITFMFGDGTTQQKAVALPPTSRTTVDINRSVSISTICDGVALHPYDYPEYWSWYWQRVRQICDKNGATDTEVIVTEIGWPHDSASRPEFSPEGQRQAIGEVGIGRLWGVGCRKIWVYRDVDDSESWHGEDAKHGLWRSRGSPMPAWYEYKNWQNQLPNYGNKPGHL